IVSRMGWHAEVARWYRRVAERDAAFAKTLTDDQIICVMLSSLAIGGEDAAPLVSARDDDASIGRRQACALLGFLLERWRAALAAGGDTEDAHVRARARTLEDQPEIRRLARTGGCATLPGDDGVRWARVLGDLAKIAARPREALSDSRRSTH